jgi:hypothetical protein
LFKAGDGNNVLEWLGEIAAVGSLSPNLARSETKMKRKMWRPPLEKPV